MNSVPAYVYYGSLADVKLVSRRVHYVPTGDMRAIDPSADSRSFELHVHKIEPSANR
jgi:hypothetical protein